MLISSTCPQPMSIKKADYRHELVTGTPFQRYSPTSSTGGARNKINTERPFSVTVALTDGTEPSLNSVSSNGVRAIPLGIELDFMMIELNTFHSN